jgi:ketosteroid isomerase-like protein
MSMLQKLLSPIALCLVLSTPVLAQTAEADAAIHEELRAVNKRLVDAINAKDVNALFAEMSPDVEFTAMNNDHVRGLVEGKVYFDRMMTGANKFLNDMSMTSEPDNLAKLYSNNQVAVATGVSSSHFDIRGGLAFDVPLRWTATLEHGSGAWKLAAIHFSADVGSNPILSAATVFWKWLAIAAGFFGLLAGYILSRIRVRKT